MTCRLLLLVCALTAPGCCKKPQCPLRDPPVVVGRCALPPGPGPLPVPERAQDCPDKRVCFTIENAAKLAGRDNLLKQWIRETKSRCTTTQEEAESEAPSADGGSETPR